MSIKCLCSRPLILGSSRLRIESPLSWPLQEQRRKEKEGRMEVSSERRRERRRRLWLFVKKYWHRLVGAAVGWFAWDFYYCEPNSMASTQPCRL